MAHPNRDAHPLSGPNRPGLTAVLAGLLLVAAQLRGQEPMAPDATAGLADAAWQQAGRPMELTDGGLTGDGLTGDGLTGDGAETLFSAMDGCRYVLFGEQHHVAGIPEVAAAALRHMQAEGDTVHVGLEIGVWIAARCNIDGVMPTLTRYPYSLAFDDNGDLELMETALAPGGSAAIWGLDQMITAVHPLQRMVELVEAGSTGQAGDIPDMLRGAFLKAALRGGRYIKQEPFADIDLLTEQISGGDPEAREILAEMRLSAEIYGKYFAGRRGEVPPQTSNIMREDHMKELFDRALENTGGSDRWLFKMGGAHIADGFGPYGAHTLGEHVGKRAEADGDRALHIGIRAAGTPGSPPLSAFGDATWLVVPVADFKSALGADGMATLSEDRQKDLGWFDLLIYRRERIRAHKDRILVLEEGFRERMLWSLMPLAAPLVIFLSMLWVPLRRLLRRGRGESRGPAWPGWMLLVCISTTVAILVWQVLVLMDRSPAPASGAIQRFSPWIVVTYLALILACLASLITWIRGWWGEPARIHGSVLAVALLFLTWEMWRRNLGGMLGS